LAAKAAQADLLTTNQAVSDLKTATNNNLDTKATKTDLAVTNQAVADLKGAPELIIEAEFGVNLNKILTNFSKIA
jgi:hypothetical protein